MHILNQRDDVPDLQAAADVFVMPSLWEGFPLAILEAMLAGTAIVASHVSGIPEADGTGFGARSSQPSKQLPEANGSRPGTAIRRPWCVALVKT